jgi:hypothetical protein
MLMDSNWLNMLAERSENKGYVIEADHVWFGNRIPGHLGIVFYWREYFAWRHSP